MELLPDLTVKVARIDYLVAAKVLSRDDATDGTRPAVGVAAGRRRNREQ
jgi:hypothetical protein